MDGTRGRCRPDLACRLDFGNPCCTVIFCMTCHTAVLQFSRLVMSEKVIRRLLKQDVIVSVNLSDPNCKRILYERGKPAHHFTLIVEGHVQIQIGSEDFVFDGGPFMYFGAQALTGTCRLCCNVCCSMCCNVCCILLVMKTFISPYTGSTSMIFSI